MAAFANDANFSERVDWRLLYNSYITLFHGHHPLSETIDWLSANDYEVHELDASGWITMQDALIAISQAFGFQDEINGVSVDAFSDVLSDVAVFNHDRDSGTPGTALVLRRFDAFVQRQSQSAIVLLDVFANTARGAMLVGHRMMCLAQSEDPDLELPPVGAIGITWNQSEQFRWDRGPVIPPPL